MTNEQFVKAYDENIMQDMVNTTESDSVNDDNTTNNVDEHPHPNDVICGRGKGSYLHIGNFKFHKLVDRNKEKYLKSQKTEKTKISRSIVNQIKSLSPPGRFIEYDATSGKWVEVNSKRAWEKTCQALRERKSSKAKCKRDDSRRSSIGNDAISNKIDEPDMMPITTAQINSLFPPSISEKTDSKDDTPKLQTPLLNAYSLQNQHHQTLIENLSNPLLSATLNGNFSNGAQPMPNLCTSASNATSTSIPESINLQLQPPQIQENEDSKFYKALRKLRRKHGMKPKVSNESIPGLVSDTDTMLQTAINSSSHHIPNINFTSNGGSVLTGNYIVATEESANVKLPSIHMLNFNINASNVWQSKSDTVPK